ncbi:MAG: hypothetical protein ACRD3S_22140 [Terracidiphilus sp.]
MLGFGKTPEQKFWHWFNQHESELFDFELDQERIFDQLSSELQKINPSLTFEFGPQKVGREFVVSADGIKSAFPAVVSLVNAAPKLDRWQVIAFRPRRTPISRVEIRDKKVDPEEVQFSLLDNGKIAGIHLFIPGFREEDSDWKLIGYLLLDEALGEYDVEERLGLIKILPADTRIEWERHPLAELPSAFDKLVARLEGRSQKSS